MHTLALEDRSSGSKVSSESVLLSLSATYTVVKKIVSEPHYCTSRSIHLSLTLSSCTPSSLSILCTRNLFRRGSIVFSSSSLISPAYRLPSLTTTTKHSLFPCVFQLYFLLLLCSPKIAHLLAILLFLHIYVFVYANSVAMFNHYVSTNTLNNSNACFASLVDTIDSCFT